jgi:predicted lipoprotein with Yx(FWY)xxD motif
VFYWIDRLLAESIYFSNPGLIIEQSTHRVGCVLLLEDRSKNQIKGERKMKSRYLLFTLLAALAIMVSACGPQATPTQAPPPPAATQASAAAASSGPAMVDVGKNDTLGSFLVDDKGMSLYLYTKDSPNTSTCYDKCATAWPPLLTIGNAVAGDGVDASKFGTTTRTDGTTQVTYNGWPLYYYAKDKQPGDVTGQKVGSVWYVVSPTGDAIKQ